MSFDSRRYWLARHEELRGDVRAVGNRTRTPEQVERTFLRGEAKLRTVLAELFPDQVGRSVLDFGCGIGRLAPLFLDQGWRYHGVELSPTAIEQACAQHPGASFEIGDIAHYQTPHPFDLVIAWAVLLHLVDDDDWLGALSCAVSALRPGGVLLVVETLATRREPTAPHVRLRTADEYRARLAGRRMAVLSMTSEMVIASGPRSCGRGYCLSS